MRIGVIGSGISGLTAAYYLSKNHQVEVFEANSYVGGHTNTIGVDDEKGPLAVDTGFIVFNDRTYPNFIRLLREIGVPWQDTMMSFSVRSDRDDLEYRGADLNGFFAQRKNLVRPSFYRMLLDLIKFNRLSIEFLTSTDSEISVKQFFEQNRFSRQFIEHYFLPMGSAIWSCPTSTIEEFPIRFIIDFYKHHGLLSVNDRPQWHVIKGGSNSYIPALTKQFSDSIHLNNPVVGVERMGVRTSESRFNGTASESDRRVIVKTQSEEHAFDHIVFACHSDQALKILGKQATETESELLSSFPYEKNVAVLHTDTDLLPKRKNAWACWNYLLDESEREKSTVTYNMNMLQSLDSDKTYCVTLNCQDRIREESIIRTIDYHHPIFNLRRSEIQPRHSELLGPNNTSFCGAYWGNGFHEDGVKSALAVVNHLCRSEYNQPTNLKPGVELSADSFCDESNPQILGVVGA